MMWAYVWPADDGGYVAPSAPEVETWTPAVPKPTRRRGGNTVQIAGRHLDAIAHMLEAGDMTAQQVAERYAAHLGLSGVRCAMHCLEDAQRVERAGHAPLKGAPIIWRLVRS